MNSPLCPLCDSVLELIPPAIASFEFTARLGCTCGFVTLHFSLTKLLRWHDIGRSEESLAAIVEESFSLLIAKRIETGFHPLMLLAEQAP